MEMPVVTQAVVAIAALLLVVAGGELFTTGTEWVSARLGLSRSSTGSVFAALATTVPETLIPVLAILQGSGSSIGIGAILGGPITITTIAVFVLGASASAYAARDVRDSPLTIDARQVTRDLRVFLPGFSVALLVAVLRDDLVRIAVSPVLVGLYLRYLYRVSRDADDGGPTEPEPLELGRGVDRYGRAVPLVAPDREYGTDPPNSFVAVQIVVAVCLLLVGSQLLIEAIEWAAGSVVPAPTILVALLVAPIVSNLPESVDGVIWVGRGRDSIAVEQLTGTLAFQGTIGVVIGVLFTRWELTPAWGTVDFLVVFAAAIALLSGALFHALVTTETEQTLPPRVFMGFGLFYLLFIAVLGYYLGVGFL